MKFNFVVLATNINLYKYMYKEMLDLKDVKVYWDRSELLELLPIWKKQLAKIHIHMHLPMKKIWYFLAVKRIRFSVNKPICFIWHNHFREEIDNGTVDYIRRIFPNSRHVYFFTDPWAIDDKTVEFLKKKMDIIAIFDKGLADKFGILYFPNVYPKPHAVESETEIEYDICFVGQDKGRIDELSAIAQLCEEHDIKTAFYIGKYQGQHKSGIQYIQNKMAYVDVVELIKHSRCLLELKVEPDNSCSLRVQEAIVFNKKLITNNNNVYNMPCCKDSKWILCYDKLEEIDWEFIKKNEKVEYNYQGEFSAERWFQRIEEELDTFN